MPINMQAIRIARRASVPLSRQLYMQLHQQILDGQVIFKERLPATRVLARQLALSRGVVVECYEMLRVNALVAGFGKGGTRVIFRSQQTGSCAGKRAHLDVSARGQRIALARSYQKETEQHLALAPGVPDFSLFPDPRWHSLAKEAMALAPAWYQRNGGLASLKKALIDYLLQYRGLRIRHPRQLLISAGSQSALCLLVRLLADPGDEVIVEDPCWSGAEAAMHQADLAILRMPVDRQGASTKSLASVFAAYKPKICVATPAVQFPTGGCMSTSRREALLNYTAEHQCWLIEDDYAAEYSYAQHPAPSIMAHSGSDHVIHVGTMSKLLLPGLRIGWIVVPEHIADRVNSAINTAGISPSYVIQQQLALFIQYGYLSTHLAQTRAIYSERRRFVSDYVKSVAPDLLSQTGSISSMNSYFEVNPDRVAIDGLAERLLKAELGCEIYSQTIEGRQSPYILLGHASHAEVDLPGHLDRLIRVLRDPGVFPAAHNRGQT